MNERMLLVLTGKPAEGEYNLTIQDAKTYSHRFYSGLLTNAHQHIQMRQGKTLYDLIVPPMGDDAEGLTLVDREGFFPVDFLHEIVAKVHSGSILFRTVEFESPPRKKR